MAEIQCGVIEEKVEQPKFPVRRLLSVLHQEGGLVVSRDAFGPDNLDNNVAEMQKYYSYPNTHEVISFREPTTSESISAAAYNFASMAKPEILDPGWLQLGKIVRAPEWVVVNPPRDADGNPIEDENILKTYLNGITQVNGIYRLPNGKIKGVKDCSFVPYGSFTRGVQEAEEFVKGGLSRGLEYSLGTKAPNLETISAKKNYPLGVNVRRFDPVKECILRVAGLYSRWGFDDGRLVVDGSWSGRGSAFGVLDKSAEGTTKK